MLHFIIEQRHLRQTRRQVEFPGVGQLIRVVRHEASGEVLHVRYELPQKPKERAAYSGPGPLFFSYSNLSGFTPALA